MARSSNRFDAVIFDLDGVLVDSEIWWDEVRRDFARTHERPWTEDDRLAVMGANSREWARTMRERLGIDVDEHAIERAIVDAVVARYTAEGPPLILGALEAVRTIAARYPVAVASSAHRDVIAAALDATGLAETFGAVVSSDEVERGKPEPDVYLEAARQLGADPRRCLVVEDSQAGVCAARLAGMTVVLVPNRSIPPAPGTEELADAVVGALAELDPSTIRRTRRRMPTATAQVDTTDARAQRSPQSSVRSRRTGAGQAPGDGDEAPTPPASVSGPSPSPSATGTRRGQAASSWRRIFRYWFSRLVVWILVRSYARIRVEGRERLPSGPAIYCFNHMNWADPFALMAALPFRPRLYFFGPREEDMTVGARNRLMSWSGAAVPYKPGKNDLLDATRRVRDIVAAGGVLAIAGEGRIHASESELLPLNEGSAYFALRSGVPIVPIAINGTSWLRLGRRIRIRIGEPIAPSGRPTREAVAELTERTWEALHGLVADHPDYRPPGRVGRWVTELFNDWPEGRRPERRGPSGHPAAPREG